jgi:predicted ester cyclase
MFHRKVAAGQWAIFLNADLGQLWSSLGDDLTEEIHSAERQHGSPGFFIMRHRDSAARGNQVNGHYGSLLLRQN